MTFSGTLREYQKAAASLIVNRERCLLALDLGTGKTVVSIAATEELLDKGEIKCALLIMSSSLTKQWEERLRQFTDRSVESILLVDGSTAPKKRQSLYQSALTTSPSYLIMGIRQVVADLEWVKKINPDLVLVDEVTSIKNFSTQQTKAIKKLTPRYRVGLTAEPIENGKAEELFSIMEWIDSTVLGNWKEFEQNYIERNSYNFITGYKNMPELNERLMTACISKRKEDPDVADFMPDVEEYNVYVEMDSGTKILYDYIARDLYSKLKSSGPSAAKDLADYYAGTKSNSDPGGVPEIVQRMVGAQLLLDDPSLLESSARAYEDPKDPRGSKYANALWKAGRLPPDGTHGAKLEAAIDLAQEYLSDPDEQHKVIIFARFKGVLYLLKDALKEYNPVLFTGDLNGTQRGDAISQFTNDDKTRVFLSSDAGGYGVDLFRASHLINYDLPQSSGVFKQRNGRHVRASSTFRTVFIDNLIVQGSIEEYFLSRLEYKARVSRAVLTGVSDLDGKVTNEAMNLTKFLEKYLENK